MPSPTGVPAGVDWSVVFNRPPEQVIQYLQDKHAMPSGAWREWLDDAHNRTFVVAQLAQQDLLNDVKQSLVDAIKNGQTYAEWHAQIEPLMKAKGWWGKQNVTTSDGAEKKVQLGSPRRMQLIYEQNMQSAYAAGRRTEMLQATDTHPYWRYIHTSVSHPRLNHLAMDGRVLRYDDPFWSVGYPPNGYGCKCRVSPMSEAAVLRMGVTLDSTDGVMWREVVGIGDGKSTEVYKVQLPGMNQPFVTSPGFNTAPSLNAPIPPKPPVSPAPVPAPSPAPAPVPPPAKPSSSWPLLPPKVGSLDEFKALGAQRLEELLATKVGDNGSLAKVLETASSPVDYLPHHPAWHQAVVDKLIETRQAGSVLSNANGGHKAVKTLHNASKVYPASWVQDANALGPLKVKFSTTERGWCWTADRDTMGKLPGFGVIRASKGDGYMMTDDSSTAVHEYAHRIQEARHDIDALFQAEHRLRTASEQLQRLRDITPFNYAPDEVAKPDGYYDAYMGREYSSSAGREALEVMTMSLQPILGDDLQAGGMLFNLWKSDQKMLELALGILFHCE